jgi:outer membrane protein assembly factor BamE (lipoprotein component of BamABCDE complex)
MSTCKWLSFFLFVICFSCNKPLPTLEGLDLERWKKDKNACNNIRINMREAIDEQKNKLLSLDQMQIVKLLGKPDKNELSTRNQKFFYYFLEPGPACEGIDDSITDKLVIRFNAIGLAKEIAIE